MKVTALYVGSSLLVPLRNAEREINREGIDLQVAVYNFGAVFADEQLGSNCLSQTHNIN
jgi:hypothetical protein